MDMIKKIALTASTMLFVLTQIFSFYVIIASQQEKIQIVGTEKGKDFSRDALSFFSDIRNLNKKNFLEDYALIYCFRKNMGENSALYWEKEELYNNSQYEFDTDKKKGSEYPNSYVQEKLHGKYLLVFSDSLQFSEKEYRKFQIFHVVDITYLYKESFRIAIIEILISIAASFAMALLLVFLIKKITKPLQDVNEAQRQLIGSMSHELKTPLTAIKGYAETLLSVSLSMEQEQKALDYINRESGRLSRLSEKMMELTKLYEPECKITLQKVTPEALFEEVKESVGGKIKEKELFLEEEGSFQESILELDADLAVSFLLNLVNNSIMASERGSRIFLGADKRSLWVRDEGCGIPSAEVDKVRKAFYRVDKSRSRKSGNMGLGLALCEQIAAVHHGRMDIESKPGKGTKISLILEK